MSSIPSTLHVELLSDSTFGVGTGVPGEVDIDVEHDQYGLPLLGGKALRGLLRDSWLSMQEHFSEFGDASLRVFGPHGDTLDTAILRVGDAAVEPQVRNYFVAAVTRENHPLDRRTVLESLTSIREQTSEERKTGAPARTTLRSSRVVIRGLRLVASITWLAEPSIADRQCLALTCLAMRHAGLGRNRGRGHLRITIDGDLLNTRRLAGRVE
jgi:hypothetical protein